MKIACYIFKLYFPLLIGALALFILGFEIVDLFMNIWKYIFNNVSVKTVLKILLLYLPKTVTFALPLAMLFATCYMLCILSSQNELVAFFASGVSYLKAMLPLIIFAFLMSQAYFVFEDKIVVPCYKQYQELKEKSLYIEKNLNNNNIVIRSDDGKVIYKVNVYEDAIQKLHDLLVVVRNDDNTLNVIITASFATWSQELGTWMLNSPIVYKMNEDGNLEYSNITDELKALLTELPDTFKNNKIDVETVTIKEAKEYINYLRRTGLPSSEALSVYYKKFSFSYVILIVTVLAIGLSGRSRKNVIIISMMLSLCAAVLFYVFQMVTMLLAKFGIVTPIIGAWFPVIVFMIISFILVKYART